jgi:dCMP deaminase
MLDRYRKFVPAVLAIAAMSKDRSTKVGALALGPDREIRSAGYNGFPRGVNDDVDARHERPLKYRWSSHAEENLVAQAARSGVALAGCTVMVSALYPCAACARMLIQAGVVRIIAISPDEENPRWIEDGEIARAMFAEAGVEVLTLRDE